MTSTSYIKSTGSSFTTKSSTSYTNYSTVLERVLSKTIRSDVTGSLTESTIVKIKTEDGFTSSRWNGGGGAGQANTLCSYEFYKNNFFDYIKSFFPFADKIISPFLEKYGLSSFQGMASRFYTWGGINDANMFLYDALTYRISSIISTDTNIRATIVKSGAAGSSTPYAISKANSSRYQSTVTFIVDTGANYYL